MKHPCHAYGLVMARFISLAAGLEFAGTLILLRGVINIQISIFAKFIQISLLLTNLKLSRSSLCHREKDRLCAYKYICLYTLCVVRAE